MRTVLFPHFEKVNLLMDCYTTFAAKASKYKNPINEVGVTNVYGIDNPMVLTDQTGLVFVKQHEIGFDLLLFFPFPSTCIYDIFKEL